MAIHEALAETYKKSTGKDDYYERHGVSVEEGDNRKGDNFGQDVKGYVDFVNKVVGLFKGSNVSTLLHEFAGGHVGRRVLEDVAKVDKTFAKHYDNVQKWAGVKDGKWTTKAEERFARAWENYMRTGKAPTASLKEAFKILKDALTNIYKKVKGSDIDVEISPEVTRAFDAMLGGERTTKKNVDSAYKEGKRVKRDIDLESVEGVRKAIKDSKVKLSAKDYNKALTTLRDAIKTGKGDISRVHDMIAVAESKYDAAMKEEYIKKKLDPKNKTTTTKSGKKVGKVKDASINRFYENVVSANETGTIKVDLGDGASARKVRTEEQKRDLIKDIDARIDKLLENNGEQYEIDDLLFAKKSLEFDNLTEGSYAEVKQKIDDFYEFMKNSTDMRVYKERMLKDSETRKIIKEELPKKPLKFKPLYWGNKNMNSLLETLGGVSEKSRIFSNKLHDRIKSEINKGEIKYLKFTGDFHQKFVDIGKEVYGTKIPKRIKKFSENGTRVNTGIKRVNKDGTKEDMIMSKDEAIQMYMYSKNSKLKETLLMPHDEAKDLGNGFTEESLKQLEDFIGKDGVKIANETMKLYEEMYKEHNKVYRDFHSIDLEQVESYSGKVLRKVTDDKVDVDDGYDGAKTRVTAGSQKSRVNTKATIIPRSYIESFNSSVRETGNYVAFKEPTEMMNNTLLHPSLAPKLNKTFGEGLRKELVWQTEYLAGKINQEATIFDVMNAQARKGLLYTKLSTGLKQTASTVMYAADVNPAKYTASVARTTAELMVKDSATRHLAEIVLDNPVVKYRNQLVALGMDVVDLGAGKDWISQFSEGVSKTVGYGKKATKAKKMLRGAAMTRDMAFDAIGGAAIRMGDKAPIVVGGLSYINAKGREYLGRGFTKQDMLDYKSGNETKGAKAVASAISDWLVISEATQQSQFRSNRARARVSDVGRGFHLFTSAQYQMSILLRSSYRHLYNGVKEGNGKTFNKGLKQVGSIMALQGLMSIISNKGMPQTGDDKESFIFEMAKAATLLGIPFADIGVSTSYWIYRTGKPKSGIPTLDIAGDMIYNISKAVKSESEETKDKYRYKAFEQAAIFAGIPAKNIRKEYEGIKEVLHGASENPFWSAIGSSKGAKIESKKGESFQSYAKRVNDFDNSVKYVPPSRINELPKDKRTKQRKTNKVLKAMYNGGYVGDYVSKFHNPLKPSYATEKEKLAYIENTMSDGSLRNNVIGLRSKLSYGSSNLISDKMKKLVKYYDNHKYKYTSMEKDYDKIKKDMESGK
jgi:hypothetical protein